MAVISALLVVAAVTMITASLLQRQDAFLRGVQAAQNRAQAQALLRGGLNLALRLIKEDGERNATTRGDAPWAAPITDARLAATAGGQPVFLGRLEDEQGKLNLRNLVFEGKLYQDGVEELARLCQSLGLRPEVADALAQRMLASLPPPHKAGDGAASARPGEAGRPGLAPFPRSLDELAGAPGVDAGVVARLRPYVTVLPRVTLVNVNTARAEVIAARVPDLSLEQAKALVAQRDAGMWFATEGDFANRLNLPGQQGNPARVAVQSNWFRLAGAARLGSALVPRCFGREKAPDAGDPRPVAGLAPALCRHAPALRAQTWLRSATPRSLAELAGLHRGARDRLRAARDMALAAAPAAADARAPEGGGGGRGGTAGPGRRRRAAGGPWRARARRECLPGLDRPRTGGTGAGADGRLRPDGSGSCAAAAMAAAHTRRLDLMQETIG